ncbi:MAG: hypothetical protein JSV88_07955, partial [Candidatus Aminicenantes bacterium]
GLNIFERDQEIFSRYTYDKEDPYSLSDRVRCIYEDSYGVLWIGTDGGLNKFDREVNCFKRYKNHAEDDKSLSHNRVRCIHEDKSGVLWIGTRGGLNKFIDREKGYFRVFTEENGLPNNIIYGILEDKKGNLWISTNNGLGKFNRKEKTCKNYYADDGLQNNEFNAGAFFQNQRGEMFFGGISGFNSFFPDKIKNNLYVPPIVITNFLLFNKPVQLERKKPGSPIKKTIDETETLVLKYTKNVFSFEFAALHYASPGRNQYKYMLEGWDKHWNETDSENRRATYTNLPSGNYTFLVQGSNKAGIWNEKGTSIKLKILPTPWETWWAYCIYIALILSLLYGFIRFQKNKQKEQLRKEREKTKLREAKLREAELQAKLADNQAKALKVENDLKELELKKARELERAYTELKKAHTELEQTQEQLIQSEKLASLGQLTAGIAHEIKNPLNFINNFSVISNKLAKNIRKEIKKIKTKDKSISIIEEILNDLEQDTGKILEHGKRVDSIIRGMLLHSRGEPGKKEEVDLNALLDEYTILAYHSMRSQDHYFKVKIETNFDPTIGSLSLIPQDFSRAFLNIINNACYAVNEKKKKVTSDFSPLISVSTKNLGEKIEIRIRDNGSGIPKDISKRIFNPFFTTKPSGSGTGLGLSIAYDIVKSEHKGEIQMETEVGEYTEFIITIPNRT